MQDSQCACYEDRDVWSSCLHCRSSHNQGLVRTSLIFLAHKGQLSSKWWSRCEWHSKKAPLTYRSIVNQNGICIKEKWFRHLLLDDERFQVLSEQHPARSNQTKIFLNLIENFPHMRRWSSSSSLINTIAFLRSCIRYWNSNVRPPVAEHQIRLLHRLGGVKTKRVTRQIGIPSSSCAPSRRSGCGSSPQPPTLEF